MNLAITMTRHLELLRCPLLSSNKQLTILDSLFTRQEFYHKITALIFEYQSQQPTTNLV